MLQPHRPPGAVSELGLWPSFPVACFPWPGAHLRRTAQRLYDDGFSRHSKGSPRNATAWNAGFSRHRPPQAGELAYGHSPGPRNGLERRLQPAPPAAGGRSHVRPFPRTAQRLGTPASAGTARRRRAESRTAIPPRTAQRLGTPASAGTARPGGRSHVRPFPRTAQRLGTPASAGTARHRRANSRTAIPPDRATAWNAGFSRHRPPRNGRRAESRFVPSRPFPRTAQRLGTPASAGTVRRRRAKLAYGHSPGPRNGLERRLQPAPPAPGGRSHVRPFQAGNPPPRKRLAPASAGTVRRRRANSRTAIPPDRATAWNAGFSRHRPPQAGGVT